MDPDLPVTKYTPYDVLFARGTLLRASGWRRRDTSGGRRPVGRFGGPVADKSGGLGVI